MTPLDIKRPKSYRKAWRKDFAPDEYDGGEDFPVCPNCGWRHSPPAYKGDQRVCDYIKSGGR